MNKFENCKMDKFYVIQLINKNGQSGWVISRPPEVLLASEYVTDVTRFDSYESANIYAKENKLYDHEALVKIYSNEELMQMTIPGIQPLKGTLYYLENDRGERCCQGEIGFYFKKCEIGYCAWKDPSHITELRDEFIGNGIQCDVKEIKQ